MRSATAIRSSGEAKRTPWNWRWSSAKRLARLKVARRSATVSHGYAGRVGEDLVGQVAGAQEGKIVAVRQLGDPGALLVADVALGPLAPAARSARPGCGVPWPGGSRGWPVAADRGPPHVVGWRPWAAANSAIEIVLAHLDGGRALRRTRPSKPRVPRSPRSGAGRSGGEPGRPSPTPTTRSTGH